MIFRARSLERRKTSPKLMSSHLKDTFFAGEHLDCRAAFSFSVFRLIAFCLYVFCRYSFWLY
ncbi:hypothetical protein EO92_15930 [Methanosarcina sp. 2.H.A.1B.4]|nr:hypothetical protein EO92_15930 [Methanosarcina sp. 2.H.A.1B.4]KKH50431.1 hypothetical protein EO93_07610 [Methanosarcina sp. 1.H.A.2.2]